MAKFASNEVMDAALGVLSAANRLVVLSGQPASFAAASSNALAETPVSAADFELGAGSGGGRRLQVAAKPGLTALANGTADHVALLDTAGGRLLYVTTCPAQPLLAGMPLGVAAWQIEIGAPV
jgi:hypothetical protein